MIKAKVISKAEMEEAMLDSLFKRKTPEASKLDNKKKEVHIVTKKK